MNIQSLSVVVPLKGCVNNCKFCVSRTHENQYKNILENEPIGFRQYISRLQFAKDNGCNSVIFTGIGEPLQHKEFIRNFMTMYNVELVPKFVWFELQTSGVMLDRSNLSYLRNYDISTISLSLSNMFDSIQNGLMCDIPGNLMFDIDELCKSIKSYGFNLRLSLNMTNAYNNKTPEEIFNRAKELGADQITFRELYKSPNECKQNQWIEGNSVDLRIIVELEDYIRRNGKELELLPFGARKYSIMGMTAVVDSDCMSTEAKDSIRYLVLRENCKLYSKWDDPASLIF